MAKLYDLVKFRNQLSDKLEELNLSRQINSKVVLLDSLMLGNKEFPHLSRLEEIKNSYARMIENDHQIFNNLKNFIDQINLEIENLGLGEYSQGFVESTIRWQMALDDATKNKISAKISQYCSARYPALQISVREKQWINFMVSSDPLYLTANIHPDTVWKEDGYNRVYEKLLPTDDPGQYKTTYKNELHQLDEMIAEYPDSYKRKVGLYTIVNRDFSTLPQNQFGFILCWDNFNYLNCDIIIEYLREVIKLLRPGGVFMFSYTNCELNLSARKVDYGTAAYCSSTWVSKTLSDLGYEIMALTDCTSITADSEAQPISWAEVRKPGRLSTAKIAQAQGLIRRN